nr:MAG TPA: hypothetical protein [Caudoviricetes sp.]
MSSSPCKLLPRPQRAKRGKDYRPAAFKQN